MEASDGSKRPTGNGGLPGPAAPSGRPAEDGGTERALLAPADFGRLIEAALFASPTPLAARDLRALLPQDADLEAVLTDLRETYRGRGVVLTEVAGGFAFRTAPDLAGRLRIETQVARKLSRAALETLAIIAYHQPVTRAEIEDIRGVATSKGTIDGLIQSGWIKPGGRRRKPGRPLTWITTAAFLDHFDLNTLDDLPNLDELRATGLLSPASGAERGPDSADGDGSWPQGAPGCEPSSDD